MSDIYLDRGDVKALERAIDVLDSLVRDDSERYDGGLLSRAMAALDEVLRVYQMPRVR